MCIQLWHVSLDSVITQFYLQIHFIILEHLSNSTCSNNFMLIIFMLWFDNTNHFEVSLLYLQSFLQTRFSLAMLVLTDWNWSTVTVACLSLDPIMEHEVTPLITFALIPYKVAPLPTLSFQLLFSYSCLLVLFYCKYLQLNSFNLFRLLSQGESTLISMNGFIWMAKLVQLEYPIMRR